MMQRVEWLLPSKCHNMVSSQSKETIPAWRLTVYFESGDELVAPVAESLVDC